MTSNEMPGADAPANDQHETDMSRFEVLGLGDNVLRALEKLAFSDPTDIQEQAIPKLMDGRDLLGVAQTGSGKTGAFLLPIIDKLSAERQQPEAHKPKAIILAPTRELAAQIGTALRELGAGSRLFHTVIFGGSSFTQQMRALERGVHIAIATPGRLMDHMRRGTLQVSEVETFVLDEADRMLDMGFIDDVKHVASKLPSPHQTVMFSATMGAAIRKLADQLLFEPAHVEVTTRNTVAPTIDHAVLSCHWKDKKNLLKHLVTGEAGKRTIIFTRTKAMADNLNTDLREWGIRSDSIHGDKPQFMRERVLKRFRNDNIQILVATDVAARGIDVPDITHVINYDMPLEAEAYVHRVGRTGRAGQKGTAYSFVVDGEDNNLLFAVERTIGMPIMVDEAHPFHVDLSPTFAPKKGKGKGKGRGKGFGKGRGKGGFGAKSSFKSGDKGNRKTTKRSHFDDDKPFEKRKKPFDKKPSGKKPFGEKGGERSSFADKPKGKSKDQRNKKWDDRPQREDRPQRDQRPSRAKPFKNDNDNSDRRDKPVRAKSDKPAGKPAKPARKGKRPALAAKKAAQKKAKAGAAANRKGKGFAGGKPAAKGGNATLRRKR